VKEFVCPHCQTRVSDRANVCTGCGAEIVRGTTRRERSIVGVLFVAVAILIGLIVLRALEISRGRMPLPSPQSDGALGLFFGALGLLIAAYFVGRSVARLFRRSQVRFYRSYRRP
jgi:predicted nucleic acid-binding Zn ribbon protein